MGFFLQLYHGVPTKVATFFSTLYAEKLEKTLTEKLVTWKIGESVIAAFTEYFWPSDQK